MRKLKQKKKEGNKKEAVESMFKADIVMLRDDVNKMGSMIRENKRLIDGLLMKPKEFVPVVSASPVVSEISPVSRYDDVCKEIDEKLK